MQKVIDFKDVKWKDYADQAVRVLQAKLDGYLAKIFVSGSGVITIFTKNDKDITEKVLRITKIRNALQNVPPNSQLFGELHCPGIPATSVVTLINDADVRLGLTVFAAPFINGQNMFDESIPDINNLLNGYGIDTPLTIDLGSLRPIPTGHQIELLEKATNNKWEGWVLKESHMVGWYKLKPVKTVDAFAISYQVSTSKSYAGGLKGVGLGVYRKDGTIRNLGTVGNGFKKAYVMQFMSQEQIDAAREAYIVDCQKKGKPTEPAKLAIFDLPRLEFDSLLNNVYEIGYDSIPVSGGKLRWPRVMRDGIAREDKDMEACTEDQLGDT